MKEEKIWAVKDGFLVNRDGSIYKLNWKRTGTMRKVKQRQDKDGYLIFWCNGKSVKAHRFIADCFIENPQNLPCVNHKNEIKSDNRVENLEFCDWKYNTNYGSRNERASKSLTGIKRSEEYRKKMSETKKKYWESEEGIKARKKRSKKVLQFTLDGRFVKEWVSTMEIQRVLGYRQSHISKCCRGEAHYKSAYNHLWRYKN